MLIDFRKLFPKYGIKPKGVLHVGANVGEEAPIYHELGINNVVWVEANLSIACKARENVSKYGHAVFNFAATDLNGQVTLHESNNGSQSSSILELGTHENVHPEVKFIRDIKVDGYRLDHIFDRKKKFIFTSEEYIYDPDNFDFLNIDIQGAELKALRGMGDLLHQFKWAYLEVNKEELYKGCALVGEIDEYLKGFGFKRVETFWCGNTGWGDALYIKKRL